MGFIAMCTQCARSAHAVRTQCKTFALGRRICGHTKSSCTRGMPCTQCEVLDVGKYLNPSFGPFSQVFGSVPGFFWLPKHLGCGTKTLVVFKVILKPRCSRSSIGIATSTTAEKSTWSSSLEGSQSPILDGGESTPGPDSSSSTMLLVITTTRSIDGHLANPMVLTPFSLPPSKQVTGILG